MEYAGIFRTFKKWLALVGVVLLTACGGSSSTSSNASVSVVKVTEAPAGAFSPTIAVAGNGTATGWGPATRVDSSLSGVGGYKTARDASGSIVIMWSQSGGTNGGVYIRTLQ